VIEVRSAGCGLRKFDQVRDVADMAEMEREIMRLRVEDEKANPLERLVNELEKLGVSLEWAFDEFDANKDELLSFLEIKQGLQALNIEPTSDELLALKDGMDANGDGVVTLDEFVKTLKPPLEIRKEYKKIMENANIEDPIELEEKILDLQYRGQALKKAVGDLRIEFGVSAKNVK